MQSTLDYFLQLNFKTPLNLLIFLLFLAVNSLWIYYRLSKKSAFSLTPFILINLFFFLIWWRSTYILADETEHLHCAWMVAQGMIPYRDFWQHHPPFIWLVLAPLFKILKPSAFIFEWSRILSLAIFAAISFLAWRLSKRVWQEKARLPVFLLVLFATSIYGQWVRIRPDLFMDLFLLFGLGFSLGIAEKKKAPAFLTGICFALACSFMFKQYLLLLLPLIILFFEKGNKGKFSRLAFYFTGLVIGSFPLIFYLVKHKIFSDFFFWVININSRRLLIRGIFPIPLLALGGWGCYLLFKRYSQTKDSKALVLLSAFLLVTIGSCTNTIIKFSSYYLGFWLIICAVVSSGCDIIGISKKIPSLISRSILVGLFLTLLIPSQGYNLQYYESYRSNFSEDKAVIDKLIKYCSKDEACFVFLPLHPVFNHDATRLYSTWHYFFLSIYKKAKDDAKKQNIVDQIIEKPPAVMLYRFEENQIILDLFLKDLISKEEVTKLNAFLKANYTVKYIGRTNKYYIRNDKL